MNECSANSKNLNFTQAIQALSWGKPITRKSWPEGKSFALSNEDMLAKDWVSLPDPSLAAEANLTA